MNFCSPESIDEALRLPKCTIFGFVQFSGDPQTRQWSEKSQIKPIGLCNLKKTSKRVHFARSLIREIAGFASYEKRITELLKVGKDKKDLKVAKRKLSTHKRAKKKREDTASALCKMRAAEGGEKK